jgi:hypothetical protein
VQRLFLTDLTLFFMSHLSILTIRTDISLQPATTGHQTQLTRGKVSNFLVIHDKLLIEVYQRPYRQTRSQPRDRLAEATIHRLSRPLTSADARLAPLAPDLLDRVKTDLFGSDRREEELSDYDYEDQRG